MHAFDFQPKRSLRPLTSGGGRERRRDELLWGVSDNRQWTTAARVNAARSPVRTLIAFKNQLWAEAASAWLGRCQFSCSVIGLQRYHSAGCRWTCRHVCIVTYSFHYTIPAADDQHRDFLIQSSRNAIIIFIFIHQWTVERMQYNIQNDAITLTTLKYSATVIVHIKRYQQY